MSRHTVAKASRWSGFLTIIALTTLLTACSMARSTDVQARPKLETSAATMVIADVESADRFPPGCSWGPTCQVAEEGHQVLILWLEREDGGDVEEQE